LIIAPPLRYFSPYTFISQADIVVIAAKDYAGTPLAFGLTLIASQPALIFSFSERHTLSRCCRRRLIFHYCITLPAEGQSFFAGILQRLLRAYTPEIFSLTTDFSADFIISRQLKAHSHFSAFTNRLFSLTRHIS